MNFRQARHLVGRLRYKDHVLLLGGIVECAHVDLMVSVPDANDPSQRFTAKWVGRPFDLRLIGCPEALYRRVYAELHRWERHEILENLRHADGAPVWVPHTECHWGHTRPSAETYIDRTTA